MVTILPGLQLMIAAAVISADNCKLSKPAAEAGETQAHGVILYTHPRNHMIDSLYDGCQSQWLLDEDRYRKLNITHLKSGEVISYHSLNINGEIAYHCNYEERRLSSDSDGHCPSYQSLKIKTFAPGCYSQSLLNSSGSYSLSSEDCIAE